MRWMRATKAILTGLAVAAATVVPLATSSPAQAGYQASKLVGIRMLDVNVLRSDCRTYPVEWVVGNLDAYWGAEYVVDWRLQLTLRNPSQPDERGARILLKGTDAKSGRSEFRLCGTKHSAGRFVATATLESIPRASGDCSPAAASADVSRACSFAAGAGRDRVSITTLLKRPTRITLAIATCRYYKAMEGGPPVLGRGVVYRQTNSGAWAKAAGADVLLDSFDAFGGNEWSYGKWVRTDASGVYVMTVPISTEGLSYRTRTPSTSTHLKATSSGARSVCF